MAESTRPQFDVQNEIDPYDGIGLAAKTCAHHRQNLSKVLL